MCVLFIAMGQQVLNNCTFPDLMIPELTRTELIENNTTIPFQLRSSHFDKNRLRIWWYNQSISSLPSTPSEGSTIPNFGEYSLRESITEVFILLVEERDEELVLHGMGKLFLNSSYRIVNMTLLREERTRQHKREQRRFPLYALNTIFTLL